MLDIEAKGNALRPVAIRRDDVPSRRLRPNILTREQALEQARAFARAERDK